MPLALGRGRRCKGTEDLLQELFDDAVCFLWFGEKGRWQIMFKLCLMKIGRYFKEHFTHSPLRWDLEKEREFQEWMARRGLHVNVDLWSRYK